MFLDDGKFSTKVFWKKTTVVEQTVNKCHHYKFAWNFVSFFKPRKFVPSTLILILCRSQKRNCSHPHTNNFTQPFWKVTKLQERLYGELFFFLKCVFFFFKFSTWRDFFGHFMQVYFDLSLTLGHTLQSHSSVCNATDCYWSERMPPLIHWPSLEIHMGKERRARARPPVQCSIIEK